MQCILAISGKWNILELFIIFLRDLTFAGTVQVLIKEMEAMRNLFTFAPIKIVSANSKNFFFFLSVTDGPFKIYVNMNGPGYQKC